MLSKDCFIKHKGRYGNCIADTIRKNVAPTKTGLYTTPKTIT
jgi:hypothetical protein